MTRIRNPLAFGVSLLLLAAAGALGLVLQHDAVDAPDLEAGGRGDDVVRLKGDLLPFQPPASKAWQPVRQLLSNVTLALHGAGAGAVLVTGVGEQAAGEDRVVYGAVVFSGPHPDDPARSLVVVEAESVYEPYFAW